MCLSSMFRYSKRPRYLRFSTYVSLRCLSLGPYLGFTAVTVSFFFPQQFCRVFDFFPCILYPLMYARMFVLFGIDWFVVVSIA